MTVHISTDAESDLADGYWFYERQSDGLGSYFRSCLIADIESRIYYAGIHEKEYGYYRALSDRFPHCIYYEIAGDLIIVVAVFDARRDPLWTKRRLTGGE